MSTQESSVAVMCCPKCRSRVVLDGGRLVCTNPEQRLAYPIRDGIPVMIVDEATELDRDEWDDVMKRQATESDQ